MKESKSIKAFIKCQNVAFSLKASNLAEILMKTTVKV